MNTANNPIGIFDSGVGGLTILSELQKLLPHESFIYVADQKYAPYGKKTKTQIKTRSLEIAKFFQKEQCKLIIIACNTATIMSIDYVREKIPLPIIGVVPVIKTAAEISKTKKVLILATPATVKSAYITSLIKKFAHGITVYKNGATDLENIIEKGEASTPKIDTILRKSFQDVLKNNIDVVILGCTHYPFLKEKMQKIIGEKIAIIDSGGAVARQTKRILEREKMLAQEKKKDLYYTTKDKNSFEKAVGKLTDEKITALKITI